MRILVLLLSLALPAVASAEKNAASVDAKVRVYAFFATWCVPCRVEIPHLERLHREYAERGVEIILVSEDAPSTAQSVPVFLARFDVSAKWQMDSESTLLAQFNPAGGLPYLVVLAPDGSLAYAHAGYEPGDEVALEEQIEILLASEPSAKTDKVAWRVSSQSLGIWRESQFQTSDQRQRAFAQRLEATAENQGLHVSVRVDGELVDEEQLQSSARVERALLSYKNDSFGLHLGDRYAQFGHGLSLSLRKIDSLGQDTSLRGGRVQWTQQGHRITVLGGVTNRQNLDPIDLRIVDDEKDVIVGAESEFSFGDNLSVSPYVLAAKADTSSPDGGDVDWRIAGMSASLQTQRMQVATEAAVGSRRGLTASGNAERIWAAYASAQWQGEDVSLLLDSKLYKDWAIGRTRSERSIFYHEAPTLEREDQEVPANDNVVGARTRLEWRLPGLDSTLYANMLGYRFSQDGSSALEGSTALHGYVGGESRFGHGGSIGAAAGFRNESKADGSDKLSLAHLDLDAALPLSKTWAATFKWNHREETKIVFNALAFRRGLVVAGLSKSGLVTASLLYGYSTEAQNTPTHYPGAELLFHLARGGQLRAFVGRLTGGRVCVSGSCRDVPPFEGARLDLILRL